MSNFSYFMKANKKVKENVFHPVTASLCDDTGKPLDWEFRHITSKENDEIREDCTKEIPVTGKPNLYRPHVDGSKYTKELLIKSIVTPDLYNVELQNSYGVKKPDDLLMAMVDNPGEYNALVAFVQNLQGFNTSFNDLVDEAKN